MKQSIVEYIEGSSDLQRIQGHLYPSSVSWTVVFYCTFNPMKPGWEKEIIVTHILRFFVICSNLYIRILDRRLPLFGL